MDDVLINTAFPPLPESSAFSCAFTTKAYLMTAAKVDVLQINKTFFVAAAKCKL